MCTCAGLEGPFSISLEPARVFWVVKKATRILWAAAAERAEAVGGNKGEGKLPPQGACFQGFGRFVAG